MSTVHRGGIIDTYAHLFENKTSVENEREVNLFISMKGRPGYEVRDGKMFLTEWSNPLQDKKMFGISLTALGNAFVDAKRTIASDESKNQIIDSEVCAIITQYLWLPSIKTTESSEKIVSKLREKSEEFNNRSNSLKDRDNRISQIYDHAASAFEKKSQESRDVLTALFRK
ncbi:MAG: hypothetical protein K940chlam5_00522 [Candidatus Anoxychlamydiales bacterium]|nr:hypothetical protein [Candidatus Anoxychlamydiales bacterium]